MKVFSLRLSDELAAGVEAARGDVPLSVWVRRAIEQKLARQPELESIPDLSGRNPGPLDPKPKSSERSPVSSDWAKRDVVPIPKGGR